LVVVYFVGPLCILSYTIIFPLHPFEEAVGQRERPK